MGSAQTAETVDRVVGRGPGDYERVRARLEALTALELDGVLVPTRVSLVHGDLVAVSEPGEQADTLAGVLAARGAVRAGEAVWVGIAVARALAALHRAGIVHGAIDASAVVLTGGGVAVGRLADGALATSGRGDAPQQSDDLAALGALLAGAVRDQDKPRLAAWTEPMTHTDPAGRPSAAMVARALSSCATPEPLVPTPAGVANALRRSIAGPAPDAPRLRAVEQLPEARWWRLRVKVMRHARTAAVVAGAALVLALGAAGVAWLIPDAGAAAATGGATRGATSAVDAPADGARDATLARFAALAEGDSAALIATTAPGSPARDQAVDLGARLDAGSFAVAGLEGEVVDATVVRLLEPQGAASAPRAVVRVTYTLGPHSVTRDGVTQEYAAYQQSVDLTMVGDASGGWWVEQVSEASATDDALSVQPEGEDGLG